MKLRAATDDDLGYLAELSRRPEVEPFLAPGGRADERLDELLAERAAVGEPCGLFVMESDAGEAVGGVALKLGSAHSRICNLRQLMVDPGVRGSGIGTAGVWLACHHALVEHDFHRVQTETYGDNLTAHRLFERVGFVREGVRRRAYWRDGQWRDGVLYGMLAGELESLAEGYR